MNRGLVIADDFSGAAEIAGIAKRYGIPAHITRSPFTFAPRGLTVVDTDSRDHDGSSHRGLGKEAGDPPFDFIYKKTDSVLRGHILEELSDVMQTFNLHEARLLAQNPSRGRVIVDQQYLIDDRLLHETTFASDPEHPAKSSDVLALLRRPHLPLPAIQKLSTDRPSSGVVVCEASTEDQVRAWVEKLTAHTLPAGSADFFAAILEARGFHSSESFVTHLQRPRLFICGSTAAHSSGLIDRGRERGAQVLLFRKDLAEPLSQWQSRLDELLKNHPIVVVAIDGPIDAEEDAPRQMMTRFGIAIEAPLRKRMRRGHLQHILIEGGATASSICHRMDWTQFDVTGELAPGVVQLRELTHNQSIIVKPGSYTWPDFVWSDATPESP